MAHRKEDDFKETLLEELKGFLKENYEGEYEVDGGCNLIYKLIINSKNEIKPTPINPKRGEFAYQTDILISEESNKFPLVVIETKWGNIRLTRSVVEYSDKAIKHKEIYPHLRYGMVWGTADKGKLPRRYFIYNFGLDFAYIINTDSPTKIPKGEMKPLCDILKNQIATAKEILNIMEKKEKIKYYSSHWEWDKR